MSDNTELSTVVGLLDDEYARQILQATSIDRLSKTELAEECDVSAPTVSRRIDRLESVGLVEEETRLRSDGHHDTVYVATLDRFEIQLRDGEFEYDLQCIERDLSDELERLWSKF
ncbi:ArsR/SmtB family transcription factor [Halovenus rubra]|uniref:ArsR/SmtB family transcription factor n=2 Tax=Halovenus rubra TaxID=869890 RepID=A0ACC7E1R0_9EURY